MNDAKPVNAMRLLGGWAALGMLCLFMPGLTGTVAAAEAFVVRDIQVEGLQRISDGTVYNYLPVNVGDTLDRQRIAEAFRAVYSTGFFDDVEFRRDGDTLVIAVVERPAIASFKITGNKDIKTEDLETNLKGVGLAPGLTFDRSVLDNVKQFLTDEYFSRGKYGASVETKVTELDGNRVSVAIEIKEGSRAQIRQINIVGNTIFSDQELLDEFELKTPNWLSFYRKDDRYSREALTGDLESLNSYYLDRGYANFAVESSQVTISPDKKHIFITVNIREGDTYTISDVSLSGDLVVPERALQPLVLVKPGDSFSRKALTQTSEFITFRLGQEGYSRARVDPIPNIDHDNRTVSLNLRVEPGQRVYVRRINFNGTSGVNDEVFRREMRQMEGAWLNNAGLERSKERIQRLPFVQSVEFETVPVSGSSDMVDVEFEIEEGLPGQFGGGVGYSGAQGVLLNGNFTHSNFLGSGNRVAAQVDTGRFSKVYSISYTNPYVTPDAVSRRVAVAFSDVTRLVSGASDFSTQTKSATLEYGWPLSEYSRLRLGVTYQDSELLSGAGSSPQFVRWVTRNGNPFDAINDPGSACGDVFADVCGTAFQSFEIFGGYSYDTRDRVIFPTRGTRHQLSLGFSAPGSEVEYYVASYELLKFWPVWRQWKLAWNLELAFGEGINDTTSLPPNRNFFAGGPDSVRGYRQSRIGPLDDFQNPYGGNIKTVSQLELIVPTPEKLRNSTRISLFFDAGNVFSNSDVRFNEFNIGYREAADYSFDASNLRQSVGVAVQWLAPLGVFKFSYAFPINDFKGDERFPGDDLERFQFTVGSAF